MIEWSEARGEVLELVQQLVRKYHPSLLEAHIGVIFRKEGPVSNGKQTYAKAQKVDAKYNAVLEGNGVDMLDFLIWIAEDVWNDLTDNQRLALVDHELCHCVGVGGEFKIVGHDFEEFSVIIERWGLWNQELLHTAPAFKKALQLDLGLKIESQEPTGGVVAVQPALMLGIASNASE